MSPFLSGMTPEALRELALSLGEKAFRGKQLFEHLHRRDALTLDEIKVLPGAFRQKLADGGHAAASLAVAHVQESVDGTVKLGLQTHDGRVIETVLIPMDTGLYTQCISSQVGCALGCAVCMTGTLGFTRNLDAAEIVDQVRIAHREYPDKGVRNLVFMGMGEPLLNLDAVVPAIRLLQHEEGRNLSYRRITVSTAGIIPGIERLGKEVDVLLAVSLNAPTQALREQLMPITKRYPLADLMAALKRFPLPPRRRLTFEYVLVGGVNDGPEHARELVRLLSHVRCKVNLIPFNPFPGTTLERPTEARVDAFLEMLASKHMTATIRKGKGMDIQAACGQLAGTVAGSDPSEA
jgi:23S rRNA (adenine2503-C2)-methyltransferase